MKNRIIAGCLIALVALSCVRSTQATTWAPKEVVCPNCKVKNTFKEVMSYGTYIFQWPSKYEYIFWPLTDSPVLYSCKKCHLTALMWDFEALPKDKFPLIQKQLEGVKLEGNYDEYTKIPMSQRLAIAEKVYSVLDKDDQFWCQFYRVLGYHLDLEKQPSRAGEARTKALAIAEKLVNNKANAGIMKELLLITGAMRHFLKDDAGALNDFKKAQGVKFNNAKMENEANENVDRYLTELLTDYIQKVRH